MKKEETLKRRIFLKLNYERNKFRKRFNPIYIKKVNSPIIIPDIASHHELINEWRLEDECSSELSQIDRVLKKGSKSDFFKIIEKIESKSTKIPKTAEEILHSEKWKINLKNMFNQIKNREEVYRFQNSIQSKENLELHHNGFFTFKLEDHRKITSILEDKINQIKLKPSNKDHTYIDWDRSINVTNIISQELEKQIFGNKGVFSAISNYFFTNKLSISTVNLIYSTNNDLQYKLYLGDLKEENDCISYHIDPKNDVLKAIIYLSDVSINDGPFSIIPNSHLYKFDRKTELFGRALATGTYCNSPESRRSVFRLPSRLRKSYSFGRLITNDSDCDKLIKSKEKRIIGDVGTSTFFIPGSSIHRGGICKQNGSRLALQLQVKIR